MNTGIYEIVNTANGKRYVGSAVNLYGRFHVHRSMLRKGNHHSRLLQRAWDKHGADNFSFKTLLLCATGDLLLYEQRAIDAMLPEYNIERVAGSALGIKWTPEARARKSAQQLASPHFLGRKHSPETKAKMSASMRGNTNTKGKKRDPDAVAKTAAAHTGMKRSAETRARISKALTGKKPRPRTPEHCAALSVARIKWEIRKRAEAQAA